MAETKELWVLGNRVVAARRGGSELISSVGVWLVWVMLTSP